MEQTSSRGKQPMVDKFNPSNPNYKTYCALAEAHRKDNPYGPLPGYLRRACITNDDTYQQYEHEMKSSAALKIKPIGYERAAGLIPIGKQSEHRHSQNSSQSSCQRSYDSHSGSSSFIGIGSHFSAQGSATSFGTRSSVTEGRYPEDTRAKQTQQSIYELEHSQPTHSELSYFGYPYKGLACTQSYQADHTSDTGYRGSDFTCGANEGNAYNRVATNPYGFNGSQSFSPTNISDGGLVARTQNAPFTPSHKLLSQQQVRSLVFERQSIASRFTRNYQGEIDFANLYLPEEENCCLYITSIPRYATVPQQFAHFEGCIFSYKLDPPIPGRCSTCAAKVAFTTREAAEALFNQANFTNAGFRILGRKVKVAWNRNKSRPLKDYEMRQSRVIQIRTPPHILTEHLVNFFRDYIDFNLVDCKNWLIANGQYRISELHFESILGQSRAAMKCFTAYAASVGQYNGTDYSISYVPDPCDSHSTYGRRAISWN